MSATATAEKKQTYGIPDATFGPFQVLEGRHIDMDVEASRQATKAAREAALEAGVAPEKIAKIVERRDKFLDRTSEPFYSVNDLCSPVFNRPGFPPKFRKLDQAAQQVGMDPQLLKLPGESMVDFANRISRLAQEGYKDQPLTPAPDPIPQPQPIKRGK